MGMVSFAKNGAAQAQGVVLHEDRVRDQLSAAEELIFLGHREAALVAAGAALEGALRLRAAALAGSSASAPALLEAVLATGEVSASEFDLLLDALKARDQLVSGYALLDHSIVEPDRIGPLIAVVIRLLEDVHQASGRRAS
jgi:uncharacterized protein YutE (UPF0331/DUF86 family)